MTKKRAERLLGADIEVRLNPDVPGYIFAYADGIGVGEKTEDKAIEALVQAVYAVRSRSVMYKAKNRCERCGRLTELQAHHKQFRSHGGTHTEENLEAVCQSCHDKEHKRKKGKT